MGLIKKEQKFCIESNTGTPHRKNDKIQIHLFERLTFQKRSILLEKFSTKTVYGYT